MNGGEDGESTPPWLFDALESQVAGLTGHGFDLDAAASPWSAKCANYYDEATNALEQDWSSSRAIWCNPPFHVGLLERFAARAIEAAGRGSTVVLLMPSYLGYPGSRSCSVRA